MIIFPNDIAQKKIINLGISLPTPTPSTSNNAVLVQQYMSNTFNITADAYHILNKYNIDTLEDNAEIYDCSAYSVKISMAGEILEVYTNKVNRKGETYPFVTYEKGTSIVSYYKLIDDITYGKYDANTNNLLVTTTIGGFSSLPDELQTKLADFPYKDSIVCWSTKDYGNILEYIKY